jgi:hypothetical protein
MHSGISPCLENPPTLGGGQGWPPAAWAGVVAEMDVLFVTFTFVAAVPPKALRPSAPPTRVKWF